MAEDRDMWREWIPALAVGFGTGFFTGYFTAVMEEGRKLCRECLDRANETAKEYYKKKSHEGDAGRNSE